MFVKSDKDRAAQLALQAIFQYAQMVYIEPTLTLDKRMEILQWIYKKIPEVNRLLVQIKTEEISK